MLLKLARFSSFLWVDISLYYIFFIHSSVKTYIVWLIYIAAAAKLLQSCLTLCDPIDGSPPGSPVPGIFQARTLEWVAISFSHIYCYKILKGNTAKVLQSIRQHIWKIHQWPQDWRRSVFISISKKGNANEWSNYLTVVLTSHASKVMLKVFQARLQQ